ncbi:MULTISPECIES: RNA polymerase sigma factor SigJ [unclassified Streptomyces]|uniref:RNA polymerase sigma factor SigJ n=1 Tax=unclassified Streptomyces TaxID=2593676 RepID=UPI00336A92BF
MAESAVFEEHRDRLWAIAYRITGSVADADDAVQESWLRWDALPEDRAEDPRSYLTAVVSRICYDQLGSARARRESYVGPWLPEPLVADGGPEDRVTLDESVGLALLTVLERLTPAERTAFILHDVFAVPFPEIAEVVGRSPESVRQLASRARRHVRSEAPRRSVDPGEHRRAVDAFLRAGMDGDMDALLEILDPRVVWHSDGGGKVIAARVPIRGSAKVACFALGLARRFDPATMVLHAREVNGAPGLVLVDAGRAQITVFGFTVHQGRITAIDSVLNPEKLRHLDLGER